MPDTAEATGTPVQQPEGPGGAPLVVLVGTPSRRIGDGPRLAHLVGWRLDRFTGRVAALLGYIEPGLSPGLDAIRREVQEMGKDRLRGVSATWVELFEDRPEITIRRDHASSAAWLRDKKILILGCGALGGPAAEFCVRAGAARVNLVDDGTVTPGILVRQPYTDADIGQYKATALAQRLRGLCRDANVREEPGNAITTYLQPPSKAIVFDVIIDATADVSVRAALEYARAVDERGWPPILTMLVGHQARRGIVTVSRPDATGAGHDILRRLGIAARTTHTAAFADIAADLYPPTPRSQVFLPEPGCSAPTFIGSAAETTALSAALLTAALDALAGRGPAASHEPMSAAAARLDQPDTTPSSARGISWIGWPNDVLVPEATGTLQVRLSRPALSVVRAEARRGARTRDPKVETGGMLLGEIDEAVGIVFIDSATGPPPDSLLGTMHFQHGIRGAQELVAHHLARSGNMTGFIGMWHTHPYGRAVPSPTDETGMANLVAPVAGGPPRSLMMIFGGEPGRWEVWRDDDLGQDNAALRPAIYARLVRRIDRNTVPGPHPPPPGRYFPGGFDSQRPVPRRPPWWRRLLRRAR